MSTESGPSRTQLLVLAVLVAVLVVGIFIQFRPGGDDSQANPDGDSPSVEVETSAPPTAAPPGSSDDPDPPGVNAPDEVLDLAGQAVKLYTEWSYRDSGPNDWMDRLAKVSTAEYISALKNAFGATEPEANWTWEEVERDQTETRTTIVGVEQDQTVPGTKRRFVIVVTYETSKKTKDTDWAEPENRLTQNVHIIRTPKGWAVDEIVTSDNLPEEGDPGAYA